MNQSSKLLKNFSTIASLFVCLISSSHAQAIFVDGKGHYALRGESRQNPSFNSSSAFQAIDQFFRLEADVRSGDQTSFITELRLFDKPREAFLGDSGQPEQCSPDVDINGTKHPSSTGNLSNCHGRHQSSLEPGYAPYLPKITKAYARYASDRCLFTVGRRGRDWGLGIYLDSGEKTFDTSASIYDGITCDINIQNSQTFGFSVGYDKITETGVSIDSTGDQETYGPTNQGDDLDQVFFSMVYDNTKTGLSGFSQKIGIYFANIFGSDPLKTDIKMADLYLAFYMPEQDLIWRNEVLFRLGKSADPNLTRLGGQASKAPDFIRNDVQSIAFAGRLDYFLSRSGPLTGPKMFQQGNFSSHSLFFEYAFAPGDKDGYTEQFDASDIATRTDKKATALALHRNYKPALILFNDRAHSTGTSVDPSRIDGIYDPGRVMNATVYAIGYEYKSIEDGTFSLKLLTANMNRGMPSDIKESYKTSLENGTLGTELIGYGGKDLGLELDLAYDTQYDDNFDIGGAFAVAIPGSAWEVTKRKPKTQLLLQAYAAFKF